MDEEDNYTYRPFEEALAYAKYTPPQPAIDLKSKGFEQLEFHPQHVFWMRKKDTFNIKKFLTTTLWGLPFSILLAMYGLGEKPSLSEITYALTLGPALFASTYIIFRRGPDALYVFVRESDQEREQLGDLFKEN